MSVNVAKLSVFHCFAFNDLFLYHVSHSYQFKESIAKTSQNLTQKNHVGHT